MKFKHIFTVLVLLLTFSLFTAVQGHAGIEFPFPDSDSASDDANYGLTAFFDLRDRESFVQVTNVNTDEPFVRLHVQIFNVAQNCNENDFLDDYTPNDTHIYDLRNILTNDGNPSGVVLPEDSYGIVVITNVDPEDLDFEATSIIGNFRVIDNNGYEYRTNMSGWNEEFSFLSVPGNTATFNFSQQAGITWSDIVGIYLVDIESPPDGWFADNITRTFMVMDVDIFDLNENPLSCRDVAFACVQPDSSFVDEILAYDGGDGGEFAGINGATVASFEYGINEAIPHTKGGELLCPSNNIEDGFVSLNVQGAARPDSFGGDFILNVFIGLNNGNGRGSMDAVWWPSGFLIDS